MCRCPLATLQECSSKYIFDFTNSCKCIPEESNDVGTRSERSHGVAAGAVGTAGAAGATATPTKGAGHVPSWELLAICGLLVGILFLSVMTFTLARYVRRSVNAILNSKKYVLMWLTTTCISWMKNDLFCL
jgi:hypothetical protein